MFALEFRHYLFHTLHIHEIGPQHLLVNRILQRRHNILLENPSIAALVKTVSISLSSRPRRPQAALDDHPTFAELLDLLPSVRSLFFGVTFPHNSLLFSTFSQTSQQAIRRICSLPSIESLAFDSCASLPSSLFFTRSNLKALRLQNCAIHQEAIPNLFPSPKRPLHLSLLGQWPGMQVMPALMSQVSALAIATDQRYIREVQSVIDHCCSLESLEYQIDVDVLSFSVGSGANRLSLSRLKHLHHIHLCFRYHVADLPCVFDAIVDAISSTASQDSPSPLNAIEITFWNVGRPPLTSWTAVARKWLKEAGSISGSLPRLQQATLHLRGYPEDCNQVASTWLQTLLPSVPESKLRILLSH
ncbi:hypothetical protein BKA70DRAFT_1313735 [Coprinopsis sp. MPI-PUGE-AT-0042]|nr:hypothetical protein BKA70DRAFT_1313735 [Coprinopsis sp. MPI-PUGE-AT-0042]